MYTCPESTQSFLTRLGLELAFCRLMMEDLRIVLVVELGSLVTGLVVIDDDLVLERPMDCAVYLGLEES